MANVPSKGGLYGGPFDSSTVDEVARKLLIDMRWVLTDWGNDPAKKLTFAFTTQTSEYTDGVNYPFQNLLTGFAELTNNQKAAVRGALDLVASFTNLTFTPAASATAQDAALRFAQTGNRDSVGGYPWPDPAASGDVFLASNGRVPSMAYFGTDGFLTITHEIGHGLGLKHSHETDYHGAFPANLEGNEFTVMGYASWVGSPRGEVTAAWPGSSPQSYMMYDIAALQALYGANMTKLGKTARYTWDAVTGQQFIDGGAAPVTGVTETKKIFSTVWTQGATATYDLSNFAQNQVNDLRPGQWLRFSDGQLADLNNQADEGTAAFMARGNVYNALLHDNDLRSAVANLITGSGDDVLIGNDRDNVLTGNAGNDVLRTNGGNDTLSGGAGADAFYFGPGHSIVRDTVADLNGDVMHDFGFSGVDILGVRAGLESLAITPNTTTVTVGGSTFQLNGNFASGGEFMITVRGSGADVHTAVNYVNYLPILSEGVGVDRASINGVANQPFLTGDGAVGFTAQLTSAVSAFANTLGYYKVAADGTISDVRVLFTNTLDVPAGTVELGAPANGERIGFFLIQDGAYALGGLPDDLSFVAAGTGAAANVNIPVAPVLVSATRGPLNGPPIFHSFADLNPDGTVQILSGTTPGGRDLYIGFEDLPSTTGDRDYQDVVLAIWVQQDGGLFA